MNALLSPIRWITASLTRQFVVLLLLALIAGQFIPFAIAWSGRMAAIREVGEAEFISRTSALSQLADRSADLRPEILAASATNSTRFWASKNPPMDTEAWLAEAATQLRRPLSHYGGAEDHRFFSDADDLVRTLKNEDKDDFSWKVLNTDLWGGPSNVRYFKFADGDGIATTMQLKDGTWLNALYFKLLKSKVWQQEAIMSTLLTAAVFSLVGVLLAQLIARPLRKLASSAEALGRGEVLPQLPETGPIEIRQLKEAFNRMQQRLTRFVDDRTRMLAAIGHDLRTPLTTLRLRAEFIPEGEARDSLINTVDEIEKMSEATLDFAKGDSSSEPTRVVDLAALVGSLCDDLAELGNNVSFRDADKTTYRCRPDGLKRAIRNLIENAVRYGGGADVYLNHKDAAIEIVIEDDGPGIPDDQVEQVFSPFYRMESSRNTETGGVGLGLSIARTIVRRHGGDINLFARRPGLAAVVVLPTV